MTDFNWKDLNSEAFREYRFPGGDTVKILEPVKLHVSASGGHRVLDGSGRSHYIPAGWIHLSWVARSGHEPFEF